ncbi:IS110 family transposase [Ruegeria atlantica]|uniref:IS110 family transposase n=2 Tax=Ruegeria TaxID=97050 RepID=A0ABX1WI27_9RHOB|nr:IS110 family transposase [Ruegeria atlantica]NOD32837.1 IS110 family transposase [Ruegeria atlantica]
MTYYIGLDVSVESTAICVIDDKGHVAKELSVPSRPDDLAAALNPFSEAIGSIGLEAGPMSSFLAAGLKRHGLVPVLMETRRVHAALSAIPVKTDRRDARGIAELLRMGWFQPVHLKTPAARDLRLILSARDTLGRRIRELDNSVRGLLRGFGLKVPKGARGRLCDLVRDLIDGNPALKAAITPLLAAREAMADEFARLDKLVRDQSRKDPVCRLLMTVPGVGAVIAMTFRAAIDDPKRFRSSKSVGACFGLTPRRYQSGETDRVSSITKAGDASVRTALYEAAHVMLVRSSRWTPLKAWAMRVAARRGAKRAKIALARKLAVILHRMWMDGTEFKAA